MNPLKRMHTKFENYMAEKIEADIVVPIYENKYNSDVVEDLVDQYVLIDYQLTVKDDMVTIELQEAPTKDAKFEDVMYSKDLTLVKINAEGSTANYRIQSTDSTEKKEAEEKMITNWLTTQPDNHEDWTWEDDTLTLFDVDVNPVETYTREELTQKIPSFPKD